MVYKRCFNLTFSQGTIGHRRKLNLRWLSPGGNMVQCESRPMRGWLRWEVVYQRDRPHPHSSASRVLQLVRMEWRESLFVSRFWHTNNSSYFDQNIGARWAPAPARPATVKSKVEHGAMRIKASARLVAVGSGATNEDVTMNIFFLPVNRVRGVVILRVEAHGD